MSALPSGSGVAARLAPPKRKDRGFLHIVRHGVGPQAIYIMTYHWLDREDSGNHAERKQRPWLGASALPKPVLAEGARALIELLEGIGLDFHLREVRGALEIFYASAQPTSPICGSATRKCLRKASSNGER